MTKEDLDAIEARANAATQGPWNIRREGYNEGSISSITDEVDRHSVVGGDGGEICSDADGLFIAAARADVPALVAEARRLRGLLTIALDATAKHGGGYVFTEAALRVALGLDR